MGQCHGFLYTQTKQTSLDICPFFSLNPVLLYLTYYKTDMGRFLETVDFQTNRAILTFLQAHFFIHLANMVVRCCIFTSYSHSTHRNTPHLSAWHTSDTAYPGRSLRWFRSLHGTGTGPREPPIRPQLSSRCAGWPD